MKKKSQIQDCGECGTKVLPTQEERCPACQNKFETPLETKPSIDTVPEQGFSWMPFLVLAGIVTIAGLMGRKKQRRPHLKLVA